MEFGVVLSPGVARVKASLCVVVADSTNGLAPSLRALLQELHVELVDVEHRLKKLEIIIRQLCRQSKQCQRIFKTPGVGELTATAIIAAVPDSREFRNGRHMVA